MSASEQFTVRTLGRLLPGVEAASALNHLSTLFKRPADQLEGLLSTPRTVASRVPSQRAERLLKALEQCGVEARAELLPERSLFVDGLVEAPPLRYQLDTARLTPSLLSQPHREPLQTERPSDRRELVSHGWWFSPTFAVLLGLPAALVIQRYLVELSARHLQGHWVTAGGIALLLLAIFLLPALLSPRRLLSLHRPGDREAELTLEQITALHPLHRDYLLHHPKGSGRVRSSRYEVGKAAYFEGDERRLYVDFEVEEVEAPVGFDRDKALADVGENLLDNLVGLSRLKPLKSGWRKNRDSSRSGLLFVIRDAGEQPLLWVSRYQEGAVALQLEPIPESDRGAVMMLALIGLGAG